MSEDWKNDRAEAAMREAEMENMKKAAETIKAKENAKWDVVKINLYKGESVYDGHVDSVIDALREIYELPKLKK